MSIKLNAQSGGSVALDAPTQTTSSADLVFKLPVADGSANQLLKTDGSKNFGWATGGKILQVVQHSFTNETESTSTSDVAITGSAKALTLTASDSSVLIIANIYCYHIRDYSGQGMSLTLRKTVSGGSITDIYEPKDGGQMLTFDTGVMNEHQGRAMQTLVHIDTPGNTGVTYELSGRCYTANNGGKFGVNRTDNSDTARSQIIFLEIAA